MNTVMVLTGPTGSGKSGIIYQLPSNLPVEIINADSRQVYKHMKIGTATPSDVELEKFPHHLFSFLDPRESFSAGEYLKKCTDLITDIISRNKTPVIVGGTFFYIKALWDGLIESFTENPDIAEKVNNMDLLQAYEDLRKLDPVRADQISSGDSYRVRKSLISCITLGKPVSSLKKSGGLYKKFNFESFWLEMDRKTLYDRINKRVESMFQTGLLTEIQHLLKLGYKHDDPGLKTIGYKEVLEICLNYNTTPESLSDELIAEAVSIISKETRHFAKRQLTWFRNEPRLKSIDPLFAVSLISDHLIKNK